MGHFPGSGLKTPEAVGFKQVLSIFFFLTAIFRDTSKIILWKLYSLTTYKGSIKLQSLTLEFLLDIRILFRCCDLSLICESFSFRSTPVSLCLHETWPSSLSRKHRGLWDLFHCQILSYQRTRAGLQLPL